MVLLCNGIALHGCGLVDMSLCRFGIMMMHEGSACGHTHKSCRRGHAAVMLTVKRLLLTDF